MTEAYRRTFANLSYFPAAAALPTVLSVILNVFTVRFFITALAVPEEANPVLLLLLVLLGNCPYILFAVAWFRLVLLGPDRARPVFFSGWRLHHWRFLRYVFAMLGITTMAAMVATIVLLLLLPLLNGAELQTTEGGIDGAFFPLAFLISLFMVIVMLRFCFVFPAAAVDETYGLAMSWQHTKGQAARIFLAALLIALPFALVTSIFGGFFAAPVDVTGAEGQATAALPEVSFGLSYYILEGIMMVLSYLMAAVTIQMIGLAFQTCTGWVADDSAAPPSPTGGQPPS